jgi:hypothetical protein
MIWPQLDEELFEGQVRVACAEIEERGDDRSLRLFMLCTAYFGIRKYQILGYCASQKRTLYHLPRMCRTLYGVVNCYGFVLILRTARPLESLLGLKMIEGMSSSS